MKKKIWELENMISFDMYDPILLGYDKSELWKFRYYEHYYNVSEYQEDHIENMVKQYLSGLVWTTQYYFNKCCSWDWYYPYINCPFASDFVKYYNKQDKKNINHFSSIVFSQSSAITPFLQLLIVIPSKYKNLLPFSYGELMTNSEIIDLFPSEVKIDILYKDMYHKCQPVLPPMNLHRLKGAIKNIKCKKDEIERNKYYDNLIIK